MSFSDDVIPFQAVRQKMRFQQIAEVRAYWEALRQGEAVPMRAQVDPRGIERALEHAFILERVAPQVARFRLAGMHLSDLAGMEVRGVPFSILFTAEARAQVAETLEAVFARPAMAELSLVAATGFGLPAIEARLILLPLRNDLGDVNRALGCWVSEGAVGRAPRRFDLTSQAISDIGTASQDWRPRPHPARGFAEPARPFDTARGDRSHLRLVSSSD